MQSKPKARNGLRFRAARSMLFASSSASTSVLELSKRTVTSSMATFAPSASM